MGIRQFIKSISNECWNIGFIQNSFDEILEGEKIIVRWVKHNNRNSWFADPFILDVTDDTICVLVEEFYKPIQKGRISKLTIDKHSYSLIDKVVVLELDTHLSFPAIERREDGICIYPENGEAKGLWLYKYWPDENRIEKMEQLSAEPLADSIRVEIGNENWMFCTKQPDPNGNELCVYQWNKESQKYLLKDIISFNEKIARMAGDIIEYKGKLYRPAQECNVQYGHAIVLQEMMSEDKFSFKEVRRLYSVHPKLNVGMHTFNMFKGVIVTDALGFNNMWIRSFLKSVGLWR